MVNRWLFQASSPDKWMTPLTRYLEQISQDKDITLLQKRKTGQRACCPQGGSHGRRASTFTTQSQHLSCPLNCKVLSCVAESPRGVRPCMLFCSPDQVRGRLSSQFCTPASVSLSLTIPPLPSVSIFIMSHHITKFTYRGLSPHKLTPMACVHH